MCTVTFIARRSGYALGMNRDENLIRPAAIAPAQHRMNGRLVLAPCEPNGGKWIGTNDSGATLALINWYGVPARVEGEPISRGEVVKSTLSLLSPATITDTLTVLPLRRINPFRLIGVFPSERVVMEWRWNLRCLDQIEHAWKTSIWISSGFDEPGAQKSRRQVFRDALREQSAGSLAWLRRLHRSHAPETGPYSVCMHRSDAATVSYSEVVVSRRRIEMHYIPGAPCCACHLPASKLEPRR